jgi:isopenicillin-N N-acyltransferase-like protein
MRGIAEGANVPLEGVVTGQLPHRDDVRVQGSGEIHEKMEDGAPASSRCRPSPRAGGFLHAHNWDWREEAADSSIVLRVRNEHGPDILTLAARRAPRAPRLQHRGVALTANFLACDRDFKTPGVPLAILRRQDPRAAEPRSSRRRCRARRALRARTTSCCRRPTARPSTSSASPTSASGSSPKAGSSRISNHFISPRRASRITDTYFARTPTRSIASTRVHDYLAARRGKIDYKDMVEALSDRYGSPDSVLRSPKPAVFDAISATVCMTVIDAEDREDVDRAQALRAHRLRRSTRSRRDPRMKPVMRIAA